MTKPDRPQTKGRRFSKRDVILVGSAELSAIERDEVWGPKTVARLKAESIQLLEASGIPARDILADSPGGSHLRAVVVQDHALEPDSPLALAARIVELCIRIETLPGLGARPSMVVADAYRLGRLVVLAKVYSIEDRQRREAAKAERPGRRTVDKEEIRSEFDRLVASGHSEREARGLLKSRGVASQSSIHRATSAPRQRPPTKKTIR